MILTDHELFIIQAAAGAICAVPIFYYALCKPYRKIKTLFKRSLKNNLTNLVNDIVTDSIHPYIKELKPNGGSSLNDTIKLVILPLLKETKEEVSKQGRQLSKLEGRFEQYVEDTEAQE